MRRILPAVLIAICAVAVAASLATGSDRGPVLYGDCVPALSPDSAEAVLRNTDRFCGVYVGYVGAVSRQACAFASVNRRPDAVDVYRRLLREAKRPGQLYALIGLYLKAPDEFARAVVPYRTAQDSVGTAHACIVSRDPVSGIVERIEDGERPRLFRALSERLAREAARR